MEVFTNKIMIFSAIKQMIFLMTYFMRTTIIIKDHSFDVKVINSILPLSFSQLHCYLCGLFGVCHIRFASLFRFASPLVLNCWQLSSRIDHSQHK